MRHWRGLAGAVLAAVAVLAPVRARTALLPLALAADAAVAVMLCDALAQARAERRRAADIDPRLALLRRTVPHLRQRRPVKVIEMQIRWRARAEAAAARRRGEL